MAEARFGRHVQSPRCMSPGPLAMTQNLGGGNTSGSATIAGTHPSTQSDQATSGIPTGNGSRALESFNLYQLPTSPNLNSTNRPSPGGREPLRRRATKRHRWKGFWRNFYTCVKPECYNTKQRRVGCDNDDFVRTIEVIFIVSENREIRRFGKVKFDTGNPKNLISPTFLAKFGLIVETSNGKPVLETPGGGQFKSAGTISGRWAGKNDSTYSFDPKFMDAVFEVSLMPERFDVVIGSDTIQQERLLEFRPDVGLTGFRTKGPNFTSSEVRIAEDKRKNEQTKNETQKRALLAKQNATSSTTKESTSCSETPQ